MSTEKRGFASMPKDQVKAISIKGGKASGKARARKAEERAKKVIV